MGKYMRKVKLTDDVVALMDVSQGVRTRAKTLALRKLQGQASKPATAAQPSSPMEHDKELSYLQLRSRRLEKRPLQRLTCCRQQNPNPSKGNLRLGNSSGVLGSAVSETVSVPIDEKDQVPCEKQIEEDGKAEASLDLGAEEGSFGENNIDLDGRERGTRESTPCSLPNAISTPGSSTRPTNFQASNRSPIERSMPFAQELEEFFTRHEQEQHRLFIEKYNFDIINEKPLGGRYEWVRVQSK